VVDTLAERTSRWPRAPAGGGVLFADLVGFTTMARR